MREISCTLLTEKLSSREPHENTTLINADTNKAIETPTNQIFEVRTISPDGKLMATVGLDDAQREVIVIRDTLSQNPIGDPIQGVTEVSCLTFSPDNKFLTTCSRQDGVVKIWDVASSKLVTTLPMEKENHCLRSFFCE